MTAIETARGAMFGSWLGSNAPLIERAEGVRLWDVDGKEYIDATSGAIAVISVGHGRQEVIDAMAEQAAKFSYVQGGRFRHTVADELADELARYTPGDLNRVIFVSGGSEANETAIKLARAYQLIRGNPTGTSSLAASVATTATPSVRSPSAAMTTVGRHTNRCCSTRRRFVR